MGLACRDYQFDGDVDNVKRRLLVGGSKEPCSKECDKCQEKCMLWEYTYFYV